MSLQLNIFILLFGGLQGLLFSFFLLRKKLHQGGNIYLLGYFAAMLLQLTLKTMNKVWLMDNWPLCYSVSHYLPLLYGPLAYLFVQQTIRKATFTWGTLLHFLPFAIIVICTALAKTHTSATFVGEMFYNPHVRVTILLTSIATYHWLALVAWKKHHKYSIENPGSGSISQHQWLKVFITYSFMVGLLVIAALYLLYLNYPSGHQYRYGFAALTVFIYWISYTALKQPALFSVIKGGYENLNAHIPAMTIHRPVKKYAASNLDAADKQRICTTLETLIQQEKLFLDADLSIDQLADKVGCSRHYLSQVLNECMLQSFYDYINHHRVEEAKKLLLTAERKDHKIASIAYDAGFNSLSTFNDVFKKVAGCTPSQYRRYPGNYLHKERV